MKNKTLHNAFPIVAAAIGNRFGIKVSVGGDQAYTNGQSIQLPAYEGNDPDYQDYAWGLLAHEAAHIRYSDFSIDFGTSVLRRRLSGAIEDVRIEHELAKDFPGTRLTLRTVIEKMIAQGRFGAATAEDHPANVLYSYVLKSLRARVLGQVALNPWVEQTESVLSTKFPPGVVIRLKGLLSEVPDELSSEHDCLQLADRILAMIEQEVEQQKQKPQNNQSNPSTAEENKSDADDQVDSEPTGQADGADETPDSKDDANTTGQDNEDEENSLPSSMLDSEIDSGSDDESGSGLTDEQDDVEQLEEEANANPVNSGGCGTEPETPDHSQILESLLTASE
ncbi:MAG: nitric oxide reductase activation protein, partial [Methylococcaceae bacterium]